jgi:hypothetical protein
MNIIFLIQRKISKNYKCKKEKQNENKDTLNNKIR